MVVQNATPERASGRLKRQHGTPQMAGGRSCILRPRDSGDRLDQRSEPISSFVVNAIGGYRPNTPIHDKFRRGGCIWVFLASYDTSS
jgi:hypothetical protein